jgi:O-antigen ligase
MNKKWSLKNGLLSLIILAALIFILPLNKGTSENTAIFIVQLMIIALFTLSFLRFEDKVKTALPRFELFFLAFIGFGFAGYFYSSYPYATLLLSLDLFFGFILYRAARRLVGVEEKWTNLILISLVAISLIEAVIAFRQYFFLDFARAKASFVNPNHLATLINISLGIIIAFLISKRGGLKITIASVGAGGFLFLALLVTGSRGGFIAFFFIIILASLIKGKKRALILFIGILLALIIIPNPVKTHLLKKYDIYAFTRLDIWRMSFRIFADHPILGVGLSNFKVTVYPYNFPVFEAIGRYAKIPRQAHNSFLEFIVETGLIGGILLTAALLLFIVSLYRFIKKKKPSFILLASLFPLLAVFIQALFSNTLHSRAILYLSAILAAILCSRIKGVKGVTLNLPGRRNLLLYCVPLMTFFFVIGSLLPFIGERYYQKGLSKIEQGDIIAGSRLIQQSIKVIPIQPDYRMALADLYLAYFRERGNIEAFYYALASYNQAAEISPAEPKFVVGRINCYLALMERGVVTGEVYQLIKSDYERALSLRPYDVFLLRGLAYLYLNLGEYPLAEEALNRAIYFEPNYVAAHYDLSKLYILLGRTEEGKRKAKKAADILARYGNLRDTSPYLSELLAPPEGLLEKAR